MIKKLLEEIKMATSKTQQQKTQNKLALTSLSMSIFN